MKLVNVLIAAALIVIPAAAFAAPMRPLPQDIHARKFEQQSRIAQGVRSGQLTPRETSHLEHQEMGINREDRGMRMADNGHLTRFDRATLERQQNVESRSIFDDKHNDRMDY